MIVPIPFTSFGVTVNIHCHPMRSNKRREYRGTTSRNQSTIHSLLNQMALVVDTKSLSFKLEQCNCIHIKSTESNNAYPNISCMKADLYNHGVITVGNIKSALLNKRTMEALNPSAMWAECQAYDAAHVPEAKLNKVENYLANESFPSHYQAQIDEAEWVLYIDEVYIDPRFRGKGLSLLTLDLLIQELDVGEKCIVLLQAGSIVRFAKDPRTQVLDALEAYEKIARHWRRMGFREWSDSDDAWLCLWSSDRPRVGEVVAELVARREVGEVLES